MKTRKLVARIEADIALTYSELQHLMRVSTKHYDSLCQSMSQPGGTLFTWEKQFCHFGSYAPIGADRMEFHVDFHTLDVLCKICEGEKYEKDAKHQLYWTIKDILTAMNAKSKEFNGEYKWTLVDRIENILNVSSASDIRTALAIARDLVDDFPEKEAEAERMVQTALFPLLSTEDNDKQRNDLRKSAIDCILVADSFQLSKKAKKIIANLPIGGKLGLGGRFLAELASVRPFQLREAGAGREVFAQIKKYLGAYGLKMAKDEQKALPIAEIRARLEPKTYGKPVEPLSAFERFAASARLGAQAKPKMSKEAYAIWAKGKKP